MKKEVSPLTVAAAVLGVALILGIVLWRGTSQPAGPTTLPANTGKAASEAPASNLPRLVH